jgi:hypothetical protein
VRVRSQAAIEEAERTNPDPAGPRFIPATMAAFCGRRFRIRSAVTRIQDADREVSFPLEGVLALEGATCPGTSLSHPGACDGRCALLWRSAWLEPTGR